MPFRVVSPVSSVGLVRLFSISHNKCNFFSHYLVLSLFVVQDFFLPPFPSFDLDVLVVLSCPVSFPSRNVNTL